MAASVICIAAAPAAVLSVQPRPSIRANRSSSSKPRRWNTTNPIARGPAATRPTAKGLTTAVFGAKENQTREPERGVAELPKEFEGDIDDSACGRGDRRDARQGHGP